MTEIRVDQILQESGTGPVNFETEFTLKGKALNDSAGALQMTKIVDSATNPTDSDSYYGLMWFDSSNDRLNIYTPVGWRTLNGTAVASGGGGAATFSWGGDRAILLGGATSSSTSNGFNNIQYYDITASGNAIDFGDLSANRSYPSAVSSQTRVVTAGGISSAGQVHNWLEYVTPSTTGNSTSFGSFGRYAYLINQGASDGTYGLFAGGYSSTTYGGTNSDGDYGSGFGYTNSIDYITIATTGNSQSFGSLTAAGARGGSVADSTRAVTHQIQSGGYTNILEYVTIASPGNATDFGDLSVSVQHDNGCSDTTRGIYGGGGISSSPWYVNNLEFITIQTTGNATDFGDLTSIRQGTGASSNGTYGTWAGGFNGSSMNNIDRVTIQTTGNSTDHGDLTTITYVPASGSGNPA
jgi:hypothetical protein